MGGEGSGDVLMLSVEVKLGTSLWGAYGICEGGMANIRGHSEASQNTLDISRGGVLNKSDE